MTFTLFTSNETILSPYVDFVCSSGAIVGPSVGIVFALADGCLFDQVRDHLCAKLKIPYSCKHRWSKSG